MDYTIEQLEEAIERTPAHRRGAFRLAAYESKERKVRRHFYGARQALTYWEDIGKTAKEKVALVRVETIRIMFKGVMYKYYSVDNGKLMYAHHFGD